jgi:metal-responsive CopG/Arc/MetJ family transcriptional regulator
LALVGLALSLFLGYVVFIHMKTISITLDDETLSLIEKHADGDSRSLVIRKAIKEYAALVTRKSQEAHDRTAYAVHKKSVNASAKAQRGEQARL